MFWNKVDFILFALFNRIIFFVKVVADVLGVIMYMMQVIYICYQHEVL